SGHSVRISGRARNTASTALIRAVSAALTRSFRRVMGLSAADEDGAARACQCRHDQQQHHELRHALSPCSPESAQFMINILLSITS
ncbi:hypothetical protein ACWC5I_47310, partial [Kitasatospora sp. NPDC001574]